MSHAEPLIRNISDTALWAAVHRARESERPDAVFRDPFARRLAGTRGDEIAASLSMGAADDWSWTARTYLFDQVVTKCVAQDVDMVVNLAAGLDARPYRMSLPTTLRWVEIDLPEIIAYKESALADETPACALQRHVLDLADLPARRALFAELGSRAENVLVLSEGLVIYLSRDEVASLARDLTAPRSFRRWALELASPGLLEMIQKKANPKLDDAGAPLKFAPSEGPGFFTPLGWTPVEVRSFLKTAAHLKRLRFPMWLLSLFPESEGKQGRRPWAGVCLFDRR